jgi:hypothetical protein
MPSNRAPGLQLIDPILTNVARRYKSHSFIADQLMPKIRVSTLTGKYPVFDKAYWFGNEVDNRTQDRAPSKEIDFKFDTETYAVEEYAFKVSITDLERQQADGALRLETNKTEFLMHRQELSREVRVATLLRKTDVTGGGINLGATPSTNWDQATATIELDIQTGINAIYDVTGMTPNTIVIPYKVASAMAVQEDIRTLFLYTVNGQETLRMGAGILPSVIWGMRVVIPMGPQYTTANEGAASPTYSEIWGDHIRLLTIDPNAGWGIPSVAYDIVHTNTTVTRWRENDPDVEYIRVKDRRDEKVVAPDAGYVISSVLS